MCYGEGSLKENRGCLSPSDAEEQLLARYDGGGLKENRCLSECDEEQWLAHCGGEGPKEEPYRSLRKEIVKSQTVYFLLSIN